MEAAGQVVLCICCNSMHSFRCSVFFFQYVNTNPDKFRNTKDNASYLVDRNNFADFVNDRLVLTICWRCEKIIADYYNLPATINAPSRPLVGRLCGPYISCAMIAGALSAIQTPISSLLSGDSRPRPVVRIECVDRAILHLGAECTNSSPGALSWDEFRYHGSRTTPPTRR